MARRRQRRDLHELQHEGRRQSADRLSKIAGSEQMRRQQVFREDDELWANDRGKNSASEHPGNDLWPVGVAGSVSGGKVIGLVGGAAERSRECAQQEKPEMA